MLPEFLIIGAMKGGTSSLYRYIASHPDVSASHTKETNFFKTPSDFRRGLSWYKGQFLPDRKLCFEASPNYTKRHVFPGVPERMHAILPNAKLIYLLRDPIERIKSHYVHNVIAGREHRSLSEVIASRDKGYIQTSMYFFQLECYLSFYSPENILLIESEDLSENTAAVLERVFKFLGLDSIYDPEVIEKRFHSSQSKSIPSQLESFLTGWSENRRWRRAIENLTKSMRTMVERPKLTDSETDLLVSNLTPDVERLRSYSGLRFEKWNV